MRKMEIYNRSLNKNHNSIDFVDMIYLPITNHKIKTPKFDFVFVDESQDNNACQHAFINTLLSPKARTVFVGDEFQCIYSFMGGDINSFKQIQERPNTLVLPLSTSFRCSKQVVAVAKQICPTIEAYEQNENGSVRYGDIKEIKEGDLVLSRNNRPLFYIYFQLLEQGKSVVILGKDIEIGLQALISKVRKKSIEEGINHLQEKLEKLKEELLLRGVKKVKEHPQYIALHDKVRTICIISDRCYSMSEVSLLIESIFSDKDNCIKLCTIHHSKGLENERVFLIERFNGQKMLPSPFAEAEWQKIQERNLSFVAFTRAKSELIFIQNVNDND